jgi:hypothetical protein
MSPFNVSELTGEGSERRQEERLLGRGVAGGGNWVGKLNLLSGRPVKSRYNCWKQFDYKVFVAVYRVSHSSVA